MEGLIFGILRYDIQHVDVVERKSNNDMFYTVPHASCWNIVQHLLVDEQVFTMLNFMPLPYESRSSKSADHAYYRLCRSTSF